MAIQDPVHFELPSEYRYIREKIDFKSAGLVDNEIKTFEESDIEELFMIKNYMIAKQCVNELIENARRRSSENSNRRW